MSISHNNYYVTLFMGEIKGKDLRNEDLANRSEFNNRIEKTLDVLTGYENSDQLPNLSETFDFIHLKDDEKSKIQNIYREALLESFTNKDNIYDFCKQEDLSGEALESLFRLSPKITTWTIGHGNFDTESLKVLCDKQVASELHTFENIFDAKIYFLVNALKEVTLEKRAGALTAFRMLLLSPESSSWFFKTAKTLITKDIDANNISKIISALAKVEAPDQENFVEIAKQLITQDMKDSDISQIIATLATGVKAIDRKSVAEAAKQLIKQDMKSFDISQIISALAKVEAPDQENFVEIAKQLITQDMKDSDISQIIATLATGVKAIDRKSVAEAAKQLIKQDLKSFDISQIISALAKVEKADRENVAEVAKQLITEGINSHQIAQIISALATVKKADRENVVEVAKQLVTEDINSLQIAPIIEALAKVEENDRESVAESAKKLITQNMRGFNIRLIISALAKVEKADRENVVEVAKKLITEGTHSLQIAPIIEALAKVEENDRESVAESAKKLITQNMRGCNVRSIIETLAKVKENNRESFVETAQRLITKGISSDEIAPIIEILEKIEAIELKRFVEAVKKLITKNMQIPAFILIIKTLAEIKAIDRRGFVEVARRLITDEMKALEIEHVIEALVKVEAADLDSISLAIKNFTLDNKFRSYIPNLIKIVSIINPHLRDSTLELIKNADITIENDFSEITRFVLSSSNELFGDFELHLENTLKKIETNKQKALHLSSLIQSLVENGVISESSLLFQNVLEIQHIYLLKDEKDPKHPILLFKNLTEAAKTPIEELETRFPYNIKHLQKTGSVITYTAKDLADYNVDKDTLKTLFTNIKERIEQLPENEKRAEYIHIAQVYGTFEGPEEDAVKEGRKQLDSLEENLVSSKGSTVMLNYTKTKTSSAEKPIDAHHFKTFVILNDILKTEDTALQQEKLLNLSMSVHMCSTGQKDGIDIYFRGLDNQKAAFINTSFPILDRYVHALLLKAMYGKLISVDFLKELGGGGIQTSHETLYLLNKLSSHIGYPHEIAYDRHSKQIPDKLFKKTLKELLAAFFEALPIDLFVKSFTDHIEAISQKEKEVSQLKDEIKSLEEQNKSDNIRNLEKEVNELNKVYQKSLAKTDRIKWQDQLKELNNLKKNLVFPPELLIKRKQLNAMEKELIYLYAKLSSDELKSMFGEPTFEKDIYAYKINGEPVIEMDDMFRIVRITPKAVHHILESLQYINAFT